MNPSNPPPWHDLALALVDKLTGRGTEITYEAKDLVVHIPEEVGRSVAHTPWIVNGSLKISTRNVGE